MLSPRMILMLCVFVSTLLGTRPETNKVKVERDAKPVNDENQSNQ